MKKLLLNVMGILALYGILSLGMPQSNLVVSAAYATIYSSTTTTTTTTKPPIVPAPPPPGYRR